MHSWRTTRVAPTSIQKYPWLSEQNKFEKSWSIDHLDNTDWMPPAVATGCFVYIANKRDDVYGCLAADWNTGDIKTTWRFPDNNVLWNTWGVSLSSWKMATYLLGGFFSVKRFNTSELR